MTKPSVTQRFVVVLVSDGDVVEREIGEVLEAVGFHGVLVMSAETLADHEHPCPSRGCVDTLREHGHVIPAAVDCCHCWAKL